MSATEVMVVSTYTSALQADLCALRSLSSTWTTVHRVIGLTASNSVAGATALAYDTLLLFAQEVRYVWSYALPWRNQHSPERQFSLPRILILLIRYITLVNVSFYIMST